MSFLPASFLFSILGGVVLRSIFLPDEFLPEGLPKLSLPVLLTFASLPDLIRSVEVLVPDDNLPSSRFRSDKLLLPTVPLRVPVRAFLPPPPLKPSRSLNRLISLVRSLYE